MNLPYNRFSFSIDRNVEFGVFGIIRGRKNSVFSVPEKNMSKHFRRKKNKSSKSRSHSVASLVSQPQDDGDPPNEQLFEIKTSKIMGRYIVATTDLKPGQVIMKEEPIVVGPCNGGKVQCLGCYKNLEETKTFVKCNGCGWPLCSQTCTGLNHKYGHTQTECSLLKSSGSRKSLDYSNFEQMGRRYHAIVPLRCLTLNETDPQAYQHLLIMETHDDIRRTIPEIWQANQDTVVDTIVKEWGMNQYTEEQVHSICGVLEINTFEIGQQGVNIRGLYPAAYLMSHDCIPNTNHTDEEDEFRMTVRASVKIRKGEPITLSYAYTLQSTLRRREHLLDNKFFECQCKRCSDPTEMGTYGGALMCPKCKTGLVLSTNSLDSDADWCCSAKNGCVGYRITAKSMHLLIDRISSELEEIPTEDVASFEAFLQKYRNVLHPTHYLCLGVKLSLSQLYGKITGYLIHELSEELLLRKLKICEEIMEVFDVIEPGYTRLRGVTLYEMHAPVMILLTRKFETSCSKNELKTSLKRVMRCLEEACVILENEPQTSPEGAMGVAAKDALFKIKDWERILGRL